MFQSLFEIAKSHSPARGIWAKVRKEKNVMLSLYASKKNKRTEQLVIRISKELCIESRFIPGDRLDVLVDKDARIGLIKRVKDGGYAASVNGIKQDKIKDGYYPITLKMTWVQGMPKPSESVYTEDVEVKHDGIYFNIPEQVEI